MHTFEDLGLVNENAAQMVQNPVGGKAKAKAGHLGMRIYICLEVTDVMPSSQKSIVSWNRERDSEVAARSLWRCDITFPF